MVQCFFYNIWFTVFVLQSLDSLCMTKLTGEQIFKNMFKYITYKTGKKHILYFLNKNKKGNKMKKKRQIR